VMTEIGGEIGTLPFRDVLVIENIGLTETESFGPLIAARHNMGLQLSKRKFASKFFANGMHAGGILQVPPGASDKARRKIEESLRDKAFTKDNAFKTMVLRDGFKWHQTMIDPERAQMTEVEEQEVRNIARFYRMAPSRLGVKESISYNSEEAARRAYHDETLSYWLTAIKSECNLKLLSMPGTRNRFVDYKIEALLWADTATVISVGVQGVTNGIFSRDEVRRWFNMNPIPDGEGEKFLVPLNMGTAGDEPEQHDDPDEDAIEEEQNEAARAAIRQVIANAIRRSVRPTMRAIERAETGKRDAAEQKLRQMLGDIEQLAESAGYGSDLTRRMADAIMLRPLDCSQEQLESQLPGWMLDKETTDA